MSDIIKKEQEALDKIKHVLSYAHGVSGKYGNIPAGISTMMESEWLIDSYLNNNKWYYFGQREINNVIHHKFYNYEKDEFRELAIDSRLLAKIQMAKAVFDTNETLEDKSVRLLKIALADAIRRPMGVIPDSAKGLITEEELEEAEKRREQLS